MIRILIADDHDIVRTGVAEIDETVQEIVASVHEEALEARKEFQAARSTVRLAVIVFSAATAVLGLLIGILLTRSITGPLNSVISGISDGASQVSAAAGQVSTASQSLAEGNSEQAASLEETTASLEEMSAMTKQNAANADQANALAKESRAAADNGNVATQRMPPQPWRGPPGRTLMTSFPWSPKTSGSSEQPPDTFAACNGTKRQPTGCRFYFGPCFYPEHIPA